MSDAITGIGSTLTRNGDTIAEVLSISGPGMTREMIDVTSLGSTGGYREKIPSFRDAGDMSLSMNYTKTSYTLMKTDFESDVIQTYELTLPDGSTLSFDGYVAEQPLTIDVDNQITMDVTITISGEPIFVESTA